MHYTNSIEAARAYAAQGMAVFACPKGSKVPPEGSNGFKDATTDAGTIEAMFSQGKNVAIATGDKSGTAVIDVDTYAGGTLDGLKAKLGELPETRMAKTRAGGLHYFFKYPNGYSLGSYNSQIAPKVDLKANGGYVIAAPSWVRSDEKGPAGKYEWINDLPLAELPEAWVKHWEQLNNKGSTKKASENSGAGSNSDLGSGGYVPPERVEEGGRNSAVLSYCGYLRGKGMPESLILGAARDFNRSRCTPPLDDAEVEKIAKQYANPEANDPSGWPDPKPINAALPEVKPFDYELLPDAYRPFVEDQAELMQVDPGFIAVPLMVGASAVIGNTVAIAPKEHDISWLVVPVTWGGVVGRPGMLKSPAIDRALRPLSNLEAEMQAAFDQRKADYNVKVLAYKTALKKAEQDALAGRPYTAPVEPEEPKPERIVVNDSTAQMLGEIQRHSHRGVLVLRDELVSLLESLAAQGQEGARGYYLEGWNGTNSYRVDRIGRGSFIIPRHALWVFGGIQPGKLQAYVRQAVGGGNGDDGLLQRFQMLVWPDVPNEWKNIDRQQNLEAWDVVEETFKRLRNLDPVSTGATVDLSGKRPAYLHFTSEAQEMFNKFREKFESQSRSGEKHEALESHLAKYRSLVPALALVIHLVDKGTGPVTKKALSKAIKWSTYLWSHAKRVYASVTNAAGFGAKALADKIIAGQISNGFTARDIQRHGWQFLATTEDVRNAIEWLIDAGWLQEKRAVGDAGGRPSVMFNINPKIERK